MAVHYKFKSAKEFDSIAIEGHFISVLQLKERIVEKMKLGRAPDFDLLISNFQTNEEYIDEGYLVPRNTSVLVRRFPGSVRMRQAMEIKPEPKVEVNSVQRGEPSKTNADLDDFGVDLYEQPDAKPQPPQVSSDRLDEEARIKAFCDITASDWQKQTQEAYTTRGGFNRGGRGGGRTGMNFARKTPPDGYVCHRCSKPGHYIQHCPTNGDPSYNIKKVKLPTGIPRTMLVSNPDGTYAMPNGEVACLKPNEDVFEKEVNAMTASSKAVTEVPQELRCPLCKDVLKDAVLTSKCCFKSYCDTCIRSEIITKGRCVCGATNVLADDLLPNRTLRDAIERLLDSNAPSGSADNVANRQNIPDVESSLNRRAPSFAAPSASPLLPTPEAQKETKSVVASADGKEAESAPPKETEATADANGKAEDESQQQQGAGAPGKKNKAKRPRPPKQGQMPWRNMPEGMEDGHMMGYGNQGPYPFWGPHSMGDGFMPMGDNYMMPYGGPYNGYAPYEMMPPMMHDPYAYQGGMIPTVPPFAQREYGGGMEYGAPGLDYDYGGRPNMSREEYDAKKSDSRRKHDHHSRDHDDVKELDSKNRKRSRDDYGRDHRDSRDGREPREARESRDSRDARDARDRRESSRDRRRQEESGHRSSRNHGDNHSSGEDERHSSRHGRHSRSEDDYYRQHKSEDSKPKSVSQASPFYRSSHEESSSKRRKEEVVSVSEEVYEDAKHRSSSSSKRVSVFLRVKENGVGEDSTGLDSRKKSSRSSGSSQQVMHRHENSHHHHASETENESSVFNRIAAHAHSKHHHHSKKQSA